MRTLIPLLLLAAASAAGAADPSARISARTIEAHMRFLSDDLLEGRGTGTRGYDLAAAYVAAQFRSAGLAPAGDAGTFFQRVPFRSLQVVENQTSLKVRVNGNERTLGLKLDYLPGANAFVTDSSVSDAPIVFAGFGVTAPGLGYDDFAGIDVRNKVVLILSGAPQKFPHTERAYYSSGVAKDRNLAARGAVGVLTVSTPPDEARNPYERKVKRFGLPSMVWLNEQGQPGEAEESIRVRATLNELAAATLFEGSGHTLEEVFRSAEQGTLEPFPLQASATMRVSTLHGEARSSNVVALLEGSDPALRKEHVVISAHLDHLGTGGIEVDGDSLNNGAYDNASGIATLIEVARAFASMPERPKRSILFVAVTGEEKGTRGSEYFAYKPPVPVTSLAANVNIDMFLMLYPVGDLVPIGSQHSSLAPMVEQAAKQHGFEVSPDPVPEEVRFVRSDQYSFVRKGIPAVILKHGERSLDAAMDGKTLSRNWLRTIYHGPKDDMSQHFDWDSGVRYARTNFTLALLIANGEKRPEWNRGDFFGRTFGR